MTYTTQSNLDPAKKRRHAQTAAVLTALLCVLMLSAQQRPTPRGSDRPAAMAAIAPVAAPLLIDTLAVVEPSRPQPVAEPTLLDRAIVFIEPFEGRRHRVYRDTRGHLTIGVGFNLDRAGAAEDLNSLLPDAGDLGYQALRRGDTSLTDAQIDVLLLHDAQRAIDTARRQVTGFDTLPLDAQLIVIDMTFNTGSLRKWRKFRTALARHDYSAAADAMHRSLWRRQTGRRAEHLIKTMLNLSRD